MAAFVRGIRSVRSLMSGGGLYAAGALVTALLGTIFLVAILLGPGGWKWWGAVSVHGTEQSGVVAYSYRGKPYSIDDVASTADGDRTVYLDPSHPSEAALSVAVAQISDSVVVGGFYLASAGFLALAVRRHRSSIRRRADRDDGRFGEGIDPETVRRIVAARRQGM